MVDPDLVQTVSNVIGVINHRDCKSMECVQITLFLTECVLLCT